MTGKAIVVDTNFFGRGLPDIPRLRQWIRDARAVGMELWVPEVVLWELASHLWEEIQNTNVAIEHLGGVLDKASFSERPSMPYGSAAQVLEKLDDEMTDLGEGLEIVACRDEDALAGLKDQIFAAPPGEKKGKNQDLRTGAADSAWLRSVLRRAEKTDTEIVIISNDPDVHRALAAWGVSLTVHRSADDARAELFHYGIAPLELTYDVLAWIESRLPGLAAGSWPGRFPSDVSTVARALGTDHLDMQVAGATINDFKRIVTSDQLTISADGDRGSIEVDLLASAQVTVLPREGALTEAPAAPIDIHDWVFHYKLWIRIEDGQVVDFGLDDAPWAMHSPVSWDHWEEALDDCLFSYFDVPEHSREELRHGGLGKWTLPLHRYSGETITLTADVSESGWTLDAAAKAGSLRISCGRGRRRGTWTVTVQEDGAPVAMRPTYAISAFLIRLGITDRTAALGEGSGKGET